MHHILQVRLHVPKPADLWSSFSYRLNNVLLPNRQWQSSEGKWIQENSAFVFRVFYDCIFYVNCCRSVYRLAACHLMPTQLSQYVLHWFSQFTTSATLAFIQASFLQTPQIRSGRIDICLGKPGGTSGTELALPSCTLVLSNVILFVILTEWVAAVCTCGLYCS